jgi:hypothetical protein
MMSPNLDASRHGYAILKDVAERTSTTLPREPRLRQGGRCDFLRRGGAQASVTGSFHADVPLTLSANDPSPRVV